MKAALVLMGMMFWLFSLGFTIYGLCLAFSASTTLGIAVLFIEPLPLIIGVAMAFTGTDLSHKILSLFK